MPRIKILFFSFFLLVLDLGAQSKFLGKTPVTTPWDLSADQAVVLMLPNESLVHIDMRGGMLAFKQLDSNGTLVDSLQVASTLEDLQQACLANSGGYILGGKKDGNLLIQLRNQSGILQAVDTIESQVGTRTGRIQYIIPTPQNNYLVVYEFNEETRIRTLRTQRDSLFAPTKWEPGKVDTTFSLGTLKVNDFCWSPDGGRLVLVGTERGKAVIAQIDVLGRPVAPVKRLGALYRTINTISYYPQEEKYLLGGVVQPNSRTFKVDGFVMTIPKDLYLSRKKEWVIDTGDNEGVTHINLLPNGNLICTGYLQTGSYYSIINAEIDLKSVDFPYKHKIHRRRRGYRLVNQWRLSGNGYFCLFEHENDKKLQFFKLKEPSPNAAAPKFGLTAQPQWFKELASGSLLATEHSYLLLHWEAEAMIASHVELQIRIAPSYAGLIGLNRIVIPLRPGLQRGIFTIPLNAPHDLPTANFDIQILNSGLQLGSHSVTTLALPKPDLEILPDAKFWLEEAKQDTLSTADTIQRLSNIFVEVVLRNNGPGIAEQVSLYLSPPYQVMQLNEVIPVVDTLMPNEQQRFQFKVKAHSYYEHQKLQLDFFAGDEAAQSNCFMSTSINLPNIFAIETSNGQTFIPQPVIEYRERHGGPMESWEESIDAKAPEVIDLICPEPSDSSEVGTIETPLDRIPFKAEIYTPFKIKDTSRVTLRVVDSSDTLRMKPYFTTLDSIRYDEVSSGYQYRFQAMLPLSNQKVGGSTTYRLTVLDSDGEIMQTEDIDYEYLPAYHRLRVYCIGVPDTVTNAPTVKAADSIHHHFTKLQNLTQEERRFFDTLELFLITDPILTSKRELEELFSYTISDSYVQGRMDVKKKKDTIDYVLIYIASHGDPKRMGILPSDYIDNPNTRVFLFDQLMNTLGNLEVTKYVFLESCFSGHATSVLERFQEKQHINENYAFYLIAAAYDEALYDKELGSLPVLSQSICKALSYFNLDDEDNQADVDLNEDGILYFDELWNYINKTSPLILKKLMKTANSANWKLHRPIFRKTNFIPIDARYQNIFFESNKIK